MLSSEKKFIFFHIPKTAGNSIQNILRKYSEDKIVQASPHQDGLERFGVSSQFGLRKHSTAAEYLETLGSDKFNQMFKFACVRNPWDRAISYYFSPHRRVGSWDRDAFISLMGQLPPMVSYLSLPTGIRSEGSSNCADFILRYETLSRDFQQVCRLLGLEPEALPLRNQATHSPYQYYYDSELVSIVRDRFYDDIQLFEYEFERNP